YATDHHLTVGQGLTPEQAAALTKSIVLYQFQTVNGVQVLAPVVYVAAADRQKLSGAGAAIAGGSVDMNVGNLDNSGLIASAGSLAVSGSAIEGSGTFLSRGDTALNATNGITLAAQTMTIGGQNMVNTNAGVTAGGALQLAAGSSDLALTGVKVNTTGDATLTGKNVTLAAAKVENADQPAMTAGGHTENATGSQVTSGKALTIKATDNVNIIGSSARAGTTLDVTADNGSVAVVSTDVARDNQSGYTRTLSTDQQQSQLSAGTNATIKSGDDILLSGSSVTAGGNVALSAGDDINITAAQEHSASTFGKKSASSITHVGSEISAGGDLSVAAGSGSGDHDLNIVGSQLSADGNLALKADGDVTIAEATDTATLDTRLSTKGGFLGKSEKTTTHLETTTAVGSSISGAGGVDLTSDKDTVISASKVIAGDEDHDADLNITAGGDLVIASGKDTIVKDDKGSRSGFLSKGSSSHKSYDETTVASELGASGNINLTADGAAVISGSKADADKSISVTADSVSIIGAQETHELEEQRKKSGLFVGSGDGFISLWGKEQKSGKQASELNVASVLSAGTDVALKSRETDVNILGSQIYADNNITLDAARDLNITPGAESASSEEKEKRSGFGISFGTSSGGFSVGIGVSSVSDTTKQGSQTNAMATLSAGNDLTIKAGRDANLQAADVSAGRDVAITAERDVNLLSAEDKSNYESVHEQFFAGVTLSVSSGLVSAASNAVAAASKVGDGSTSRSVAHVAIAGIEAYSVLDALTNQDAAKEFSNFQNGQSSVFASASLTAGFQSSKSSENGSSTDPVSTAIRGGNSVTVEATSGDLFGHGVQIAAGYNADGTPNGKAGDIALTAGQDVVLESAQATSNNSTKNSSGGVQFDLVNPGLSFNYGKGSSNGSTVTQVNSHVLGAGDVFIKSGNDTKLEGAVVSGESVMADVGHDLIIESQLDTTSQKANQIGISGSFGGSSAPGLNGSFQKATGSAAIVSEQSGIHAGPGGFDITVGNKTALTGGLIASKAPATQNSLETGTLEFNDLDTHSKWKADSYSGGLTLTGPLLAAPMNDGESATGEALSAVSPGQIVITDPARQTQNLDDLRRVTSNTNTSLPGIPELQDILREQLKTQELYQDAAAKAAKFIGDFAFKREQAATTDEERAFWAEGGPGRAALHALAGGLLGGVTDVSGMIRGALGGATSSLLGPHIRDLVAEIVNGTSLAGTAQGEQLINMISASLVQGLAATVSGGEGAAYAGNAFKYNYLTHRQLEKQLEEMIECDQNQACVDKVAEKYKAIDDIQDQALADCRTIACVEIHIKLIQEAKEYLLKNDYVTEIAEYSLDAANRINQRQEGLFFSQALAEVEAGADLTAVAFCERSPGPNCKLLGSILADLSDGLTAVAYAKLAAAGASGRLVADDVRILQETVTAEKALSESFGQERRFWAQEPIQFQRYKVYQRNDLFDPDLLTSWREGGKVITGTNIERMASGRAPIGIDGKSVNLHHITQTQSGPIAEVTQTFHQSNSSVIHINPNTIPSGIDRSAFDIWKAAYWESRATTYGQ
ncbi:hemagglutinin repeat-containing protein, partial [Rhizobium binae]|uniref:hemagglutinin repeat-containing protein n=1 Tax=Rhizobium binae TaxID=1138190 RepID=UPI001C82F0C6